MTLNKYLLIMTLTTVVSWVSWFFVLLTINPEITNWVGFLLFYASLFVSLIGTAAIVGFLIRFIAFKQKLVFNSVKEAFRQSFFFSSLLVVSLFLLSYDLLTWTNLLLLVFGLSIFEYLLISFKKV